MSIHINKRRNQYFICYKMEGKTYTITNAKWKLTSVNKRYMQTIEEEEVIKDKKKRQFLKVTDNDLTASQLSEKYLAYYSQTHKPSTTRMRACRMKFIVDIIGDDKTILETFTISNMIKLRKEIEANTKLRIPAKNHHISAMKEFLDFLADREYITYDYSRKLQLELLPFKDYEEKKEKLKFWTNEEFDKFISTFDHYDKYRYLFLTAYISGLRVGELIALKWNDVNFEKRFLSVTKSIDMIGNTVSPKTPSSINKVSLTKSLVDELIELKKELCCSDNDYVFFGESRISRTSISSALKKHEKLANVPEISIHGLRHSCASRLINAGVSPLLVSKHLRHGSVSMTLNVYSHLFPSETENVIDNVFDNEK